MAALQATDSFEPTVRAHAKDLVGHSTRLGTATRRGDPSRTDGGLGSGGGKTCREIKRRGARGGARGQRRADEVCIVPAASIIAKTVTVKRFIVTRPRAFDGKPTEGSTSLR